MGKVQELYQTLEKTAPKDPSKAHYSTLTPTLDYPTNMKRNYTTLHLELRSIACLVEGSVSLYL